MLHGASSSTGFGAFGRVGLRLAAEAQASSLVNRLLRPIFVRSLVAQGYSLNVGLAGPGSRVPGGVIGNTPGFGPGIPGSSPGRVVDVPAED